jgi:hypothetical protein
MKQIIALLIATVFTLSSFATVKPSKFVVTTEFKSFVKNSASLKVSLKAAGKVNVSWIAGFETTTSSYKIEKSVNGGAYKTVAILMGESNDSYSFRDNVKDITGKVAYRVVMMDNNTEVNTLTQSLVIL